MNFVLEALGPLVYSIPAFIIVFFIRESFRNFILKKLMGLESYKPIYYLDPLALLGFAIANISWGGLSQRDRKDNFITWFASLILSIVLILFVLLYLHLNNTPIDSYRYSVLLDIIRLCYILSLTSIIPLPPFDLSCFYWPSLLKIKIIEISNILIKIAIITIIYFDLISIPILNTEIFLRWLNLI